MSSELHIAGIVVRSDPEHAVSVASAVSSLCGARLHAAAEGQLVITLEAPTAAAIAQQIEAIQNLAGVRSCALVYQHNEPFEAMMEELRHEEHTPGLH
jgi:nitrate reductase NapD